MQVISLQKTTGAFTRRAKYLESFTRRGRNELDYFRMDEAVPGGELALGGVAESLAQSEDCLHALLSGNARKESQPGDRLGRGGCSGM